MSVWPFTETPGDIAARLGWAHAEFDGDMLAAVRCVFIEQGAPLAKPASEPAGGGVRVKPLEWRAVEQTRSAEDPSTEETGDYEATSPFGEYHIVCCFGSDSYVWSVSFCGDFIIDKDDPDEAKAAAQADYEARIRSALSSPASSSPAALPAGVEQISNAMMLIDKARVSLWACYGHLAPKEIDQINAAYDELAALSASAPAQGERSCQTPADGGRDG